MFNSIIFYLYAQEQGQLKPNTAPKSADDPAAFIAVQGEFSYTGAGNNNNYYFKLNIISNHER